MVTIKSPIIVLVLTTLAGAANVWQQVSTPPSATNILSITFNPSNNHWFAADQKTGFWISTNQGGSWTQINNSGIPAQCAWTIDYDTVHSQLMATTYGNVSAGCSTVKFWRSSNEGTTWTPINPPGSDANLTQTSSITGVQTSIAPNGFMVWGGYWEPGGGGVGGNGACGSFYSTDGLQTMNYIQYTAEPGNDGPCLTEFTSLYNPVTNDWWIGTEIESIYHSTDGIHFTQMSPTSCVHTTPPHRCNQWTGDTFAMTYLSDGRVLAGVGSGVLLQRSACTDWSDCNWDFVFDPGCSGIESFVFDVYRDPNGALYVTRNAKNGSCGAAQIWQSTDQAQTWHAFDSGIPAHTWNGFKIIYNTTDHKLYTVGNTGSIYVTVNPIGQGSSGGLQPPTNLQLNIH